jgi:hypothetical protein
LEAVHEDFQDEVGMSFLYRMHEGQYYGDLVTPLIFRLLQQKMLAWMTNGYSR